MRQINLLLYTGLLLILIVIGCSEPEKPVSKEEAASLAKVLESSMKKRSPAKFNEILDGEALAKRMAQQATVKLNRQAVQGTVKGLKEGQLGVQIVQSLGKKGTYELVKQYEKDNHQHLIFRLYANDKLNYHDLELVKKRDQVKVSDIFIYMTGENLSTSLAQTLLLMDDHFDKIAAPERKQLDDIKRIRQLLNKENYTRANSLYKSLPAVFKQQRLFKLINIEIASGLGNDEYMKAINEYQQAYPDAPNMYMLMIDGYLMKKDYQAAFKAVNQLDSLINKDLFLDYYRGLISKMMEDHEKQGIYFERLNKNMPDFAPGILELIVHYADIKETGKAVALTRQYEKNKDADKEQLETLYLVYPELQKKPA